MRLSFVGCLAFGFVLVAGALAHDLYLMPERFVVTGGDRVIVAFHNGDAFPESEASVKVERLRDVMVRSSLKTAPLEDLRVDGNRTLGVGAIPGPGSLLVTGRTIPNLIELEPKKFEEYLKEEGLPEIVEWRHQHGESAKPGRERYSKYVKSLLVAPGRCRARASLRTRAASRVSGVGCSCGRSR